MPDPTGRGDRSRDAEQVRAVRDGDATAFGDLFDRWFDRAYDVARNVLHDDHAAADVAQDTFLAAWQQLDHLADPASFGGWVLRIARNRALDRLRQAQRTRPIDDDALNAVHDVGGSSLGSTPAPPDPADVVAAVDRDELVRVAVLALGPRDASLVDLQVRHGLTPAEIAEELGVTPNAAHQQLFRMRERLGSAIGSLLLWRRGRPACPQLASAVDGVFTFDAATLGIVDRHGRGCDTCTEARASMTSPEQLFAAIPIAAVPVTLRADVVARLGDQGVPTEPVAPEAAGPAPDPGGRSLIRRAGRRTAVSRRAAVITGSVGVVAVVTVGLVLLSGGEEPEPQAAPSAGPATAAATDEPATTALDTTEPATTAAPTTEEVATTARPSTTLRPTTTSPPTTVVAVPAPTPTTSPRSSDRDADALTPTQGGANPKRPEPGVPDTTAVPDSASPEAADELAPVTAPPPAPSVTTPPLVAPPPSTVAPTAPSTTPSPTTAPTTTVSPTIPPTIAATTTAAPAPAPVVTGFTVAAGSNSLICAGPGQSPRRFQWTSTGATSATLTIAGAPRSVPLSGPYDACAASGDTATIAVAGPGGDDSRSLAVP